MDRVAIGAKTFLSFRRILSGSFMIAGTTIGAGMLGIPLVTASSGFFPAILVTLAVWFFMVCTGLLFLEVTLSMPPQSNLFTMGRVLLGKKGVWCVGILFLFLYYCLMVAYFAAGAPLLSSFIYSLTGISLQGWEASLFFGVCFSAVVALGVRWIDRVNILLTLAMICSYALLLGTARGGVHKELLFEANWPLFWISLPLLFSAFGYHNVIPSLATYLERDRKTLKISIWLGTSMALIAYLLWQWVVLGTASKDVIAEALLQGEPATAVFSSQGIVFRIGKSFAFFAIATSVLGVAFSLVDFLGDGLKVIRTGKWRLVLTFLAFLPPFCLVTIDPKIFEKALGVAGGFGEALLNGLLPTLFVWLLRYRGSRSVDILLVGGKGSLALIALGSLLVILAECLLF